ncbi:glycosyl hydrolase, family 38 [Spiroplasma clarkii]|nr:glycosyl hydrolase, family 38 [Spiroplasma clarkii]
MLPYERNVSTKIKVVTKSKVFKIMSGAKELDYALVDSDYFDRSNFIISTDSQIKNDASEKGFYVHNVNLNSVIIPGVSYKILQVVEDEEKPFKNILRKKHVTNSISNSFYDVKFINNVFEITDKSKNKNMICI